MDTKDSVRALTRGLNVLAVLETEPGQTLHGVSLRTGLPKSTLVRLLRTLEAAGYVRRGLNDELYYPTVRTAAPPPHAEWSVLTEVAAPILDRLCHDVLWPSDLAIYDDGYMRVQETSRRRSPFLMNRAVTQFGINMLPSAMGRAYLAYCDPDERDEIIDRLASSTDRHDRRMFSRERILDIVRGVRATGYATREVGYYVTQPTEARVSAIAVPLLHEGFAVGAINLVWIARAASIEKFADAHLANLRGAAEQISEAYATRMQSSPRSDAV